MIGFVIYTYKTDAVDMPLYALPEGISDFLSLSLVEPWTYNYTSDANCIK